MTDRPIIFSAPMVRALLDGRKTQTRRVLKPQPPERPAPNCHPSYKQKHPAPYLDAYCGERATAANPRGMSRDWHWWQVDDRPGPVACRAPYAPGDRLWVREAWRTDTEWDDCPAREFDGADAIRYEADGEQRLHLWGNPFHHGRVRSPINMPRWASRLTLTVTEVRVQRLQEISEEDARSEGFGSLITTVDKLGPSITARDGFREIWHTLHGPDAWDANPWVAAISFETRRCNIDTMEEGMW